MGKYILLITFSVVLALAYFAQQSMRSSAAANEDQVERQKTVLARQIARSAFEWGISQVMQAAQNADQWPPENLPATVPDGENPPPEHEGGEYEIDYQKAGGNVLVEAWGRYGDGEVIEYRISGIAVQESEGLFNGITFDGPVTSANLSGNPRVKGGNRHAISVPESAYKDTLTDGGFCHKPENISGVNGECDIFENQDSDLSGINETLDETEDERYDEDDLCDAKGRTTIGSSGNPAFVKIEDKCEVSGNVSGTGILYVEEAGEEGLTMKGNVSWDGLIFFDGEGSNSSFQATKGTPHIEGSVAFLGGGGVDMRGNAEIQYNRDKLKNALDAFDIEIDEESGGSEVVVTNRCGGVPPYEPEHPCSDSGN